MNKCVFIISFFLISSGFAIQTSWAINATNLIEDNSYEEPCLIGESQIENLTSQNDLELTICSNQTIALKGSISSSQYENEELEFKWDLGDGRIFIGELIEFSYEFSGVYKINLEVSFINTDDNMQLCQTKNKNNFIVKVSGAPEINIKTSSGNKIFCEGEELNLSADIAPFESSYGCGIPQSGIQFLPDGNGESYTSCIEVNCFDDNQVIESISDIKKVCVEIEHSYLGDLEIALLSPSGQRIVLKEYLPFGGGGSLYLGSPKDYGENPGEGSVYCFSIDASQLLIDGELVLSGDPLSNSVVPGDYLPVGSFEELLGSTLNGEWCLEVIDNLLFDNGYIFDWTLEFSDNLMNDQTANQIKIESFLWRLNDEVIKSDALEITTDNLLVGEHCFEFEVIDELGCLYNDEICVIVQEGIMLDNSNWNQMACNQINGLTLFDFSNVSREIENQNQKATIYIAFYESLNDAEEQKNEIKLISNYSGVHEQKVYVRVDNQDNDCYDITSFQLFFDQIPPDPPILDDIVVPCYYKIEVPYANDNCVGSVRGLLLNEVDLSAFGTYILEWEFKDDFGNLSYASQNVTIEDTYNDVILDDLFGCESYLEEGDVFDLNSQRNYIIQNQKTPENYEVLFYDSHENAEQKINPLPNYYTLLGSSVRSIFVRVEDKSSIDLCHVRYTMFNLNLSQYTPIDFEVEIAANFKGIKSDLKIKTDNYNNYNFKLDDGVWSSNNEFYDLSIGKHIVSVKSITDCNITTKVVYVFGFPVFFTPNGDGYNDVWSIKNIPDYFEPQIQIFDRYGRILKVLNATNTCWDGTVKGELLPEDDYWYNLSFKDPNSGNYITKSSHFTLKR